jgi:hypothetical protein
VFAPCALAHGVRDDTSRGRHLPPAQTARGHDEDLVRRASVSPNAPLERVTVVTQGNDSFLMRVPAGLQAVHPIVTDPL